MKTNSPIPSASALRTVCAGLVVCGLLSLSIDTPPACAQQAAPAAAGSAVTSSPASDSTAGQAATAATQDPQLKLSAEKQLEAFEPAVDEPYRLGPGDVFTLDFPGRPELTKEGSGRMVVGPDGRITLPLAGIITIADKTREEAEAAILEAMSVYYTNLTVTLRIDSYAANKITVIGNVQHPGPMLFDGTPTLLDAISRAGLLSPGSTGAGQTTSISRDGIPETCTIYRGHNEVVEVQLSTLLLSHSSMADIRLRRNDIVFVPAQRENFVSVLGYVTRSGAVPLTPQSTVVSLIAQAGSLSEPAGNNPSIHIISPSTGKEQIISYKNLLKPSGNEIVLHSGDTIFVPMSGFYKATYFLQRISPVATLVALGALAAP